MQITIPERTVDGIPEGDKCYSFSRLDGGWEKINCPHMHQSYTYFSDRDAQESGLGVSGGGMTFYSCGVFDIGLSSEIGYGVKKCEACKAASRT